ncbi:hypothetical protein [Pedobacter panaciterrae]|jgi:hypothetical protein|uniref:Uncharacterized protein n=1 Tax=Pedobacter panaciterrae TaxID=363849 RepID=A0ABU8NGW1_9SPHI|nr:hypothetical protein [Pedobacter panaciterrae]NQX56750.1 hypothetical protein [Pedobacter panaciterrae]
MNIQENLKNSQDANVNNDAAHASLKSSSVQPLKTRDNKRKHNINAKMSISRMQEEGQKDKADQLKDQTGVQENGKEDDAMNYKSDRENGAYNSKNI